MRKPRKQHLRVMVASETGQATGVPLKGRTALDRRGNSVPLNIPFLVVTMVLEANTISFRS